MKEFFSKDFKEAIVSIMRRMEHYTDMYPIIGIVAAEKPKKSFLNKLKINKTKDYYNLFEKFLSKLTSGVALNELTLYALLQESTGELQGNKNGSMVKNVKIIQDSTQKRLVQKNR